MRKKVQAGRRRFGLGGGGTVVEIDGLESIRVWYWMVTVVYACISGDNGSDPPRFGEIGRLIARGCVTNGVSRDGGTEAKMVGS